MNIFLEISVASVPNFGYATLTTSSFSRNLFLNFMSKNQKTNYVNTEIKKVSESDLKKALSEVNKKNKEIRESFKIDKDTLAFRAGR